MKGKKVHFIGICGTAMAPISVMMRNLGFDVTGSDKGFFPPVSVYLKQNNMSLLLGYKKEHITSDIDFVVIGNSQGKDNPEIIEVLSKKIPYYSYPEILEKYLIKENSIVVAGEFGKTTITSAIAHILSCANIDPSFMFGGVSLNFKDACVSSKGEFSVLEGDEYNSAFFDKKSKFLHYRPKYLIVTGLVWDHVDLFPTKEDYIQAYKDLVMLLPSEGALLLNSDGQDVINNLQNIAQCPVYTFSMVKKDTSFYLESIDLSSDNVTRFKIRDSIKNISYDFETSLIGIHNVQNIIAAVALCLTITNISYEDIFKAVKSFLGVKRRLEVRYNKNNIMVIDDFAHSPVKIRTTIQAVRKKFPERHIVSIFEPHTMSARDKKTLNWYKDIFQGSDRVIISDIFKGNLLSDDIKVNPNDIVSIVKNEIPDSSHVTNMLLADELKKGMKSGDIFLFMSSGSFSGALEKLLRELP